MNVDKSLKTKITDDDRKLLFRYGRRLEFQKNGYKNIRIVHIKGMIDIQLSRPSPST